MEQVKSHIISMDDDIDAPFVCDDVFTDPVSTQLWNRNTVSYYFKSIRQVAPYLASWRFNRKVDETHKNQIKDALRSYSHPHLMGTIQLVRDKKKNYRIMNGQHRMIASIEILEEDINMDFHMHLMFEVYDIDVEDLNDYADHEDIEQLFKIANTSLALQPEDEHDIFCKKLVTAMGQDKVLSKGLVDKPHGSVYKPRILSKTLFELFKEHLPADHGMQIEDIIQKIKHINVQLSLMSNLELFGRQCPAEHKKKQRAKAHEIGFFLNLECKYTPIEWIAWIQI